ncbi:MAG: hypothetical protein KGL53_10280 [Elusimicrobia bacterium]|nr:hypothetical protein [Elusimicrobiota bacterium]
MATTQTVEGKSTAVSFFRNKLAYESTPHDLAAAVERGQAVPVDVRGKEAFGEERIPGALDAPLDALAKSYGKLPRDKTLVVYCWNITCHMATRAALDLAQKGFDVQELVGGIEEWKRKGFKTEGKAG